MSAKKAAADVAANRLAARLDDSPQGKGSPAPVGIKHILQASLPGEM